MTEIYSQNAMDPVENISYAEGIVTAVDYLANSLTVSVDSAEFSGLSIAYDSAEGRPSTYAFSVNDRVAVRLYGGTPSHIIGFTDRLWPFIPMPAECLKYNNIIAAKSIFQDTPFVKAELNAFTGIYEQISKSYCGITAPTYINLPAPENTDGLLYSIQEHSSSGIYSRRTRYYYEDKFIFETYNEETTSHVFNGTRSNIIAAYRDPISNACFVIYQINTFTNWVPQTSGRVDFDFYIYSSLGMHQKITGGYSIVTGASSPSFGECIGYSASGFYFSDGEGTAFVCGFYRRAINPFTAPSGTNVVSAGEYLGYHRFMHTWQPEGFNTALSGYQCNENGQILLSDGIYADPAALLYKKKR
jgi:hypothetical protein